jgi:hypothetical protein
VDIFWVNGSSFFHTISQWIKFRTVAPIKNRTKRTLLLEAQAVINMYEARGFNITRVEADREFSCITNDILPIALNIADADDHVHEVEWSICTVKERTRCTIQGLPFRRIPKLMMRACIEGAHKTLNQFPARDSVSEILSPLTIMARRPSPDYHDLKIEFGAYAQVFEDNDPTNTVRARTTGVIALTPTGNAQGGYYFLSLTTGRKLSRQQWDELPMPDGVIAAVEAMAARDEQPLLGYGAPVFEGSPGIVIEDEAPIVIDEHEVDEPDEQEVEDIHMDDIIENEQHYDAEPEGAPEDDDVMDDEAVPDELDEVFSTFDNEDERSAEGDGSDGYAPEKQWSDEIKSEEIIPEEIISENTAQNEEDKHIPRNSRYALRPNRGPPPSRLIDKMNNPDSSKSYEDVQFLQQGASNKPSLREAVEEMNRSGSNTKVLDYITGFIFTQMSDKAGIRKHGKVAIDVLYQEFLQLHDLDVFKGHHAKNRTKDQRKGALRAISVIKEKRCGKIKGRTIADGRPQRALYTKEETSSPTVSTDALLISIIIDACEHWDVATADVAGAHLHALLKDFTPLRMEGELVDIMCDVCSIYKEFVTYENGKKVLYLQLLKALYGCVKSALLWYELFPGTLQGMGFELNPYDTC